tara:strand:+ start:3187 stop:4038 length:852 start_codon:yes stop_codon:yes gene_type:complete
MKKVFAVLLLIVIVIIGLEVNKVVPSTLLPFIVTLHDAVKSNPHVLLFVTNARNFISTIDIQPFLNGIDIFIMSTIDLIRSIPWEKINIWYVLGIIFIIGVISEKFRVINNEIKFLKQKNVKLQKEFLDNVDSQSSIKSLEQSAIKITNILSELKKTSDLLRSTQLRSKKLRRKPSLNPSDNLEPDKPQNEKEIETQYKTHQFKDDDSNINTSDEADSVAPTDKKDELNSDILDDDISSLDLARTYIESDENDKATNIIMNVIKTGTEQEKHEARLLYMQLRK